MSETPHYMVSYLKFKSLGLKGASESHQRTTILDFTDALRLVDQRLKKYEPLKQRKWEGQDVREHLDHMRNHADAVVVGLGGRDDLIAAALRALMALQVFLTERREPELGSPQGTE